MKCVICGEEDASFVDYRGNRFCCSEHRHHSSLLSMSSEDKEKFRQMAINDIKTSPTDLMDYLTWLNCLTMKEYMILKSGES